MDNYPAKLPEGIANFARILERELTAVTAERDRLLSEIADERAKKSDALIAAVEDLVRLDTELADMTAERDVLQQNYTALWNGSVHNALRSEKAKAESERDKAKELLVFVERWANHHGQKDFMSAEQTLSIIQHHPDIEAITESYADGKIPETPNPWKELTAMTAERDALKEEVIDWRQGSDAEAHAHDEARAKLAAMTAERDALCEQLRAIQEEAKIAFSHTTNPIVTDMTLSIGKHCVDALEGDDRPSQ